MRIEIDRNLENADWTKATWDIIPPTVDTFLRALRVAEDDRAVQLREVAHFMTLPAARAMPDTLRTDLRAQGLLP